MTDFPNSFADETKPVPSVGLGQPAVEAVQQLAAKGYEVHFGLTPELAQALTVMARQPSIQTYCPNDSGRRFTNQAAAGHWLAKRRGMFLLLKRTDDSKLRLAGYGWAGNETSSLVPGGETTFALRVGEAGQGQGLATPFAWLIVAASAVLYGAQNMWLETWGSNGGAVHVYHKIGFINVVEVPGQRPLPDGRAVDDSRIYMSLPNDLLRATNT